MPLRHDTLPLTQCCTSQDTECTHYGTFWIKVSTVIPTEVQVNHIYVYCCCCCVTTEWNTSGLLIYVYILDFNVLYVYTYIVRFTYLQHCSNYMYQPLQLVPPMHLCVPYNSHIIALYSIKLTACCFWRHAFIHNSISNTDRYTVRYVYMSCTYSRDGVCLLRDKNWIFKYSYYLEWTDGFPQPRVGFDLRPLHVRFVVDQLPLWQVSLPVFNVFPCQYHSTITPYSFIHLPPTLYTVSRPVLQFSPVSTIPPMLHTHSFTYHPHYIMFLSQHFSFPCQYHSTNAPYPFIHLPPTLYNVSLPVLQFPLSVSFHHCCIFIHLHTLDIIWLCR
jgi:hypothetical protein